MQQKACKNQAISPTLKVLQCKLFLLAQNLFIYSIKKYIVCHILNKSIVLISSELINLLNSKVYSLSYFVKKYTRKTTTSKMQFFCFSLPEKPRNLHHFQKFDAWNHGMIDENDVGFSGIFWVFWVLSISVYQLHSIMLMCSEFTLIS